MKKHCGKEAEMTPNKSNTAASALSICLILLSLASNTLALAPHERCSANIVYTQFNCSGKGLVDVPWLHSRLMSLDLSHNNFPVLRNSSFIRYSYLKSIYLRNSSLRTLESDALKELTYLKVLDLSNNRLQAVPKAALARVADSLEQLFLSGNAISEIPVDAFVNLKRLRLLDLGGNSIYRVYTGAFRGLYALEVLKLRHNALKTLPSDSFRDSPLEKVQLYGNSWYCDCRLRWLRLWMNTTDPSVWNATGYQVRCDGPPFLRDASLDSRPLEELACEVQMKTSGATRDVEEGGSTSLLCKYDSVPREEAVWLKNSEPIAAPIVPRNIPSDRDSEAPALLSPSRSNGDPGKYLIHTWTAHESSMGGYRISELQVSELHIRDFQYEDIARYECRVQNIRGRASITYRLTLAGVDFDSVATSEPSGIVGKSESGGGGRGLDSRDVIIAVAIVVGIVLLVATGILIACGVTRVQRRRMEKRRAIEENVKQHFIDNSVMTNNGDATKPATEDEGGSVSGKTHDSGSTTLRRPIHLPGKDAGDVGDPPYVFQQPGSPFNNGNTYVSFGSELTEPGELTALGGTLGRAGGNHHNQQPPPPHHQHLQPRGYESSHAGSGTPLLDRGTPPSIIDSDEPLEDYAQYPVYDSLTNTLQRPNGETSSVYGGTLQRGGGDIYGGSLHYGGENPYGGSIHPNDIYGSSYPRGGENIYGGSLYHGEPIYSGSLHHGENIYGGSLYHGENIYGGSMRAGPYPPSSPLPRPPTNARPASTLPAPVPRYATESPHQRRDYRDYRDMRYPAPMGGGKKSLSVGNLGHHYQPAPRKPPRLFQSREYMELVPNERPDQDYITSPEAQRYGQNYGITPGTPV